MDESKKRQSLNGVAGDIWECYFLEYSGKIIDELLIRVHDNYLLTKEELEKLQGIDLDLYLKREDMQEEIFDRVLMWLTQYSKLDYVNENLEDLRNDLDERLDAVAVEFSNVYDTIFGINTSIDEMEESVNTSLDELEESISETNTALDDLTTRTEGINIILNGLVEAVENLQKLPPSQDILPVYKAPTVSLNTSKTIIELDSSAELTLTPIFNKNDAGNIKSVKIYKDGVEISSTNNTKQITVIGLNNTTTFKVEIAYADGPIKDTTTGVPYPDTAIKEGVLSYELKVVAVSASYYGVGEATIKSIKNTKALTWKNITCTNDVLIYKYPKSFGKLTSIKDANNFEYINSYTYSEEDINNVTYSVYTLTDPMTVENAIQVYS